MESDHIFLPHAVLSSCVCMDVCTWETTFILYFIGTLVIQDIDAPPGMLSGDLMFNYIP